MNSTSLFSKALFTFKQTNRISFTAPVVALFHFPFSFRLSTRFVSLVSLLNIRIRSYDIKETILISNVKSDVYKLSDGSSHDLNCVELRFRNYRSFHYNRIGFNVWSTTYTKGHITRKTEAVNLKMNVVGVYPWLTVIISSTILVQVRHRQESSVIKCSLRRAAPCQSVLVLGEDTGSEVFLHVSPTK